MRWPQCDLLRYVVRGCDQLVELLRTNNLVTISFVESLLKDQDINVLILDQHMSMLEGSIGILQRRVMVEDEDLTQARRLVVDSGLEQELK